MSGQDNDTPDDDDRTQFAPGPPRRPDAPGGAPSGSTSGPDPFADDDDRTQFAPIGGAPGGTTSWPPANPSGQTTGPATAPPTDWRSQPTAAPATYAPSASPQTDYGTPTADPYATAGPSQGGTHATAQATQATQTQSELQSEAQASGKLSVGTLINNNYRIDEVLKAGGMGEVYRGVNIHTDDLVAIKAILQEKADDAEAGLLFKREARTLSRLTDEVIVRYYNYVPDPELRRYFLVMEFIDGVPLKDFVAQNGALPVDEVKTLLARLAGGLFSAHAEQVIHRDLSPDNVMLEGGRVTGARLIDFGIAQSNVVKEATVAGRFAGKFKYVAPEQLGHYGGEITPATDIYGLALLTAAAAVGKPLDMGSSIVEAVESRRSIPDLSFVPEDLRPILSYMLEPNPADRPRDMAEVRDLVEDPRRIPEKYLGGWVPPAPPPLHETAPGSPTHGITQTGTLAPGLQMPGASATQTGPLTTSLGPMPMDVPEEKRGGSGVLWVMILAFLAAMGGAGYYAWSEGLLGPVAGIEDPDTSEPDTPDATADAGGIPAPLSDTREGFLAGFDTGPCTFVTRIDRGANAGVVEGYSATGETFAGVPVAYEERFGARPEVLIRDVTQEQCAVLEFARALQGRGRNGVQMFLSTDEVPSEVPVTAQLSVPPTQALWMILISPTGGTFNLTDRLSAPVGNQRNTSVRLALRQNAEPAPQLFLAVETDEPLARAALAKNGDKAATLLPAILEEIRERGGTASASLSYLKLTPSE